MSKAQRSLLTDEQKFIIVRALAAFEGPGVLAKRLHDELGLTIAPTHVQFYDPTSAAGSKGLAQKWRDEFWRARDKFLHDISDIPLAHKAARVRIASDICRAAMTDKDYGMALQALEHAAKEIGDVFTNRSKIEVSRRQLEGRSEAELIAELQELSRQAITLTRGIDYTDAGDDSGDGEEAP